MIVLEGGMLGIKKAGSTKTIFSCVFSIVSSPT